MSIDFGSVSLTQTHNGEVRLSFFNSVRCIGFDHGEAFIEMTYDTAADLFAALAEYLPLRQDEAEEQRVREILGQDTPD